MSEVLTAPAALARARAEAVGMDAGRLAEATRFAEANETPWPRELDKRLRDGEFEPPPYNAPLGPLFDRGGPAGLVLRRGQVASEWGETRRADLTFSVAKSYLAVLAGIAHGDGLIDDLDAAVGESVADGGFESDQNRDITWRHLLHQTAEWEGTLFDRPDWIDRNRGVSAVSDNSRKGQPRTLGRPGSFWEYNDVRVNRLSLALLRIFRRPLPEVLKQRIMDPIGAGEDWHWHAYDNAEVEVDGRRLWSVPGGTHWGGGLRIGAEDQARLGLLIAAGGVWRGRRLLSKAWIKEMLAPCPVKPIYGFLWWLNTGHGYRPAAPETSVFASGAGGNVIWVDSALELVAVARWLDPEAANGWTERVIAAIDG